MQIGTGQMFQVLPDSRVEGAAARAKLLHASIDLSLAKVLRAGSYGHESTIGVHSTRVQRQAD